MQDDTFIQKIADLAQAAQKAEVLETPAEATGVYFITKPNGEVQKMQAAPPVQNPILSDMDSLAAWGWKGANPTAYVSLAGIKVKLTDPRYSVATMPIVTTKQLHVLTTWDKDNSWMDQKQVIRVLRAIFWQSVPDSVVAWFRTMKFVRNENANSDVQLSKANIGKNLEQQVTGAASMPETVIFTIPIVTNPFIPVTKKVISTVLDVDLEGFRFAFLPMPQDIEKARLSAEIDLYNLMVDAIMRNSTARGDTSKEAKEEVLKAFPIYMGTP